MIGQGNVHISKIRDVTFMSQEEYSNFRKYQGTHPTGASVGGKWIQVVMPDHQEVLMQWIKQGDMFVADASRIAILEWNTQ